MSNSMFHATTIVAVKRGEDVCIGGDGQVTMGESTIMKASAKKVRKIYKNSVVTGFAGSVADAFSLTEMFEKKLEEHSGNLKRAAVALAQRWRSDKGMRNLEALMIVANKEEILVISGNGEVIVPDSVEKMIPFEPSYRKIRIEKFSLPSKLKDQFQECIGKYCPKARAEFR